MVIALLQSKASAFAEFAFSKEDENGEKERKKHYDGHHLTPSGTRYSMVLYFC
jgi:hypothetical protein